MKKAIYKGFGISGIFLCLVILLYSHLPESIPIHWNMDGIDGYANKMNIFLYPLMLFIINMVMFVAQAIDPKKNNYRKFEHTLTNIIWLMNITMMLFFSMILYSIFYPDLVNISVFGQLMLGLMITFFGNCMPRVKQNYFVGIKTPWALANEQVWNKTHRFSGRLWFFSGIIWMICAFIPIPAIPFEITMLFLLVALPMWYSYIVYRKQTIKKEKIYD